VYSLNLRGGIRPVSHELVLEEQDRDAREHDFRRAVPPRRDVSAGDGMSRERASGKGTGGARAHSVMKPTASVSLDIADRARLSEGTRSACCTLEPYRVKHGAPEIADLEVAVCVEEEVGGLEVAVEDAL